MGQLGRQPVGLPATAAASSGKLGQGGSRLLLEGMKLGTASKQLRPAVERAGKHNVVGILNAAAGAGTHAAPWL